MASDAQRSALRDLPSIERLLGHPCWSEAPHVPWTVRRAACRSVVDERRAAILQSPDVPPEGGLDALASAALLRALQDVRPVLQPVINATGVVLHTNLGRAPLSAAALEAVAASAGRYTNLELDLDGGQRDNRMDRLASSFSRVLGCGDVVVVNNNAAAVFLVLCALAGEGQGVVISRGELVEIGGSFRMPDIMAASGSRMVEVGTTNRTHLSDYVQALDGGASVVMKVHPSNFAVVGFTKEVEIEELCGAAHERGALVVHDLGSGLLRSSPELGEDCVQRSLEAGVDLVLFSGDKLLGGPQCGIAAGRPEVVQRLRSHPVLRLLRPGKLTLLALEATLLAWERDPSGGEIPSSVLASRSPEELELAAEALARRLREVLEGRAEVEVLSVDSTTGGGSSALVRLPSFAVSLKPAEEGEEGLAEALRRGDPAVMARIEGGRVLLDVRTLLPGDDDAIVAAAERW